MLLFPALGTPTGLSHYRGLPDSPAFGARGKRITLEKHRITIYNADGIGYPAALGKSCITAELLRPYGSAAWMKMIG
jgi:hypothetical protein